MHKNYLKAAGCALSIGLAWNFPGTALCAGLGWIGAFFAVWLLNSKGPLYLPAYLMGILTNCLGMHWLFHTISYFGGFSPLPTALIFALWATLSALQFPLLILIRKCLPEFLDRFSLNSAIAWVVAEFVSVRIFPWHLGHTQLGFVGLVQIADLVGSVGISFYMLWLAEASYRIICLKNRSLSPALAVILLPFALFYGRRQVDYYKGANFPTQEIALIQADIKVEEKHNQRLFQQNTDRYLQITRHIARPGLLVIWPEAVVQDLIFEQIGNAQLDSRLPILPAEKETSLLIGSLTFNALREIHNSALAIFADGKVPPAYHKQILMPFGEYTPGLSLFPWLAQIHSTPEFASGKEIILLDYPAAKLVHSEGPSIAPRIAALICYEDIVPRLSREAVLKGANLLANLTNDAWFGDTVAPLQHNLIAAFRAIENKRYLIRSTNSGLTAIVNPLGQTVAKLPVFSEGVIEARVALLSDRTFYNLYFGEWPWWILLALASFFIAKQGFRYKKRL